MPAPGCAPRHINTFKVSRKHIINIGRPGELILIFARAPQVRSRRPQRHEYANCPGSQAPDRLLRRRTLRRRSFASAVRRSVKAIRQALLDHNVIFFREQTLTPEQHRAFTRQFGEVVVNPVYTHVEGYPDIMPVIKEPNDRYNIGDTWHSDMSYMQEPPLGSVLYGRDIPTPCLPICTWPMTCCPRP